MPMLDGPVIGATGGAIVFLLGLLTGLTLSNPAHAGEPVALWVESFTVPPSSQPMAYVMVKNLGDMPYRGSVAMKVPDGWRITPAACEVSLQPGESKRVPLSVERGVSVEANRYPIEVSATGAGLTVVRKQQVVAASAPYFKPTIDGDPSDWKDAIPVTFTTGGKKTIVSTYWSSRRFSLLVVVEEDKLIGYSDIPQSDAPDAVQVAISPQGATTGTSPEGEAARYEFLFASCGSGPEAKCFRLAEPGMPLTEARKCRRLAPLVYDDAEVAVSRQGGKTYYEIGIPTRPIRDRIRPEAGREFCLSVLVHDPDGTGVRDWGEAAGLWESERNRLAWSLWQGAQWGEKPPFDNKLPWGMCSSKY